MSGESLRGSVRLERYDVDRLAGRSGNRCNPRRIEGLISSNPFRKDSIID